MFLALATQRLCAPDYRSDSGLAVEGTSSSCAIEIELKFDNRSLPESTGVENRRLAGSYVVAAFSVVNGTRRKNRVDLVDGRFFVVHSGPFRGLEHSEIGHTGEECRQYLRSALGRSSGGKQSALLEISLSTSGGDLPIPLIRQFWTDRESEPRQRFSFRRDVQDIPEELLLVAALQIASIQAIIKWMQVSPRYQRHLVFALARAARPSWIDLSDLPSGRLRQIWRHRIADADLGFFRAEIYEDAAARLETGLAGFADRAIADMLISLGTGGAREFEPRRQLIVSELRTSSDKVIAALGHHQERVVAVVEVSAAIFALLLGS